MSITVKLYGDLKPKQGYDELDSPLPNTLILDEKDMRKVQDLLDNLNINNDEISHIFVNGMYCGVGKEIRNGDRIGIFPRRMAIMFAEIPHLNSMKITVKLFAMLREYGPPKQYLEVPEGTTIDRVLKKINLPEEKEKNLILMVNGLPKYDRNLVLKQGDILAIFPPIAGG